MQQPQGSCLIQGRKTPLYSHFEMADVDSSLSDNGDAGIVNGYVCVKGRCLGGESGGETKYVGK